MRPHRNHVLSILFASVVGALPGTATAWQVEISGEGNFAQAEAVAVDGLGDVIAVGHVRKRFTVIKLSGATGAELWRHVEAGFSKAFSVTVDGLGDVIAAGHVSNSSTAADFTVIKFSGATGAELWRQEIDGTGTGGDSEGFGFSNSDLALSVALDGLGDVIAAGVLSNFGTDGDFTVIKFSGATGTELWRQEIDVAGKSRDVPSEVVVDGSGDVIVAGVLENHGPLGSGTPGFGDFAVIKFSGLTGAELWRREISANGFNPAHSVTLDGLGDVIAAGSVFSPNKDFTVIKFSGPTGAELWRADINGTGSVSVDEAVSVTVDGSGDVIAAGRLGVFREGGHLASNFAVIKFHGTDGAVLWRREIPGQVLGIDQAFSVTVDGFGDPIAAGFLGNSNSGLDATGKDFTVVKLSGSTGTEQWRREISGRTSLSFDRALSVTLDGFGDPIAAGFLQNPGARSDFTVIKLSGSDGSDFLVCGDGIVEALEECDDGNTADCDGCSATCTVEKACACLGGDTDVDTLCDDEDPCKHFANTLPLVISNIVEGIPDECLCGDFDGDGFLGATDAAAINECAAFLRFDCVPERDEVDGRFDGFFSATDASLVNRVATAIDPAYTLTCGRRPEGTCSEAAGVSCGF